MLTIISIFAFMARTRVPAEVTFLGALTVLLVSGVVTEEEGMSGFGSEPVVIHAAFFVIIAGLMQSGVLYWLTKNVLGEPGNYHRALIRLMVPTAVLGAVLNSVNVVALFIDAVKIWARKLNIAPSKLLLPLSYAATLGGMCTLLGNSSNLVVAGLYMQQTGQSMNLFAPLLPGLLLTIVGMAMVIALQQFIPSRESGENSFETTSDYTVELLVPTDNPAVGSTVEEAGLYNVKGGSLVEIVRFDREIIMPVPKDEWVMGGDRLIYAGQINDILEIKNTHGLAAADRHVWSINDSHLEEETRGKLTFFDSHFVPQLGPKTVTSAIILVLMFIMSSFHVFPLMAVTMMAAGLMMLFGCCRMTGVTKYIEWELLLILGVTVVFSVAITKTGIAHTMAHSILNMCQGHPYIVMAVMCIFASIVSEFVSDVGSAAVFFPIMYQQAEIMGCSPMPFVMSLMLSVTISFASPIGSSTHMLVYGPGSFHFNDFARLGICMHVVLLALMLVLVNLIYPLYP